MANWPKSGWAHSGIAFLSAVVSAIAIFPWVMNVRMAVYVREYPHDGQDVLGALFDAVIASFFTLIAVFAVVFYIQRYLTARKSV